MAVIAGPLEDLRGERAHASGRGSIDELDGDVRTCRGQIVEAGQHLLPGAHPPAGAVGAGVDGSPPLMALTTAPAELLPAARGPRCGHGCIDEFGGDLGTCRGQIVEAGHYLLSGEH